MCEAYFAEVRHNSWIPYNAIAGWPGIPGTWVLVETKKINGKPIYLWGSRDFYEAGDILTGGSTTGLRIIKEDCYEGSIDAILKGLNIEEIVKLLSSKGHIKNLTKSNF